jgi:hypothetical protein
MAIPHFVVDTFTDTAFGGNSAGRVFFPVLAIAPATSTTQLATCVTEAARCRFCTSLNAIDSFNANCDVFDDGVADTSCP